MLLTTGADCRTRGAAKLVLAIGGYPDDSSASARGQRATVGGRNITEEGFDRPT